MDSVYCNLDSNKGVPITFKGSVLVFVSLKQFLSEALAAVHSVSRDVMLGF